MPEQSRAVQQKVLQDVESRAGAGRGARVGLATLMMALARFSPTLASAAMTPEVFDETRDAAGAWTRH